MLKETKQHYFHLFGLAVLIYLVIFLKLDSFHMRWWDESMFAVNTYEMLHNGKYFSLYFEGVPDLFNTKPPLLNWIQVIFVKLLGYNELALRLPSAIAASLSVVLIFNFIYKQFNLLWAWLSVLILLTSSGFIHFHTARTGDADSLLTFLLLTGNIYLLKYLMSDRKQYIFLFLLFISLAFATKMYAALLFVPAYFIILIQQKKMKAFISNFYFLSGVALLILSAILLISLRELDTPGYLQEILFKDAGRIFKVVENHKESATFYFDNLFEKRFSIWAVLLIMGAALTYFIRDKSEKRLMMCLLVFNLVYLIIITISITKLEWYDMPLYPYMSVMAAYPLYLLIRNVSSPNHFSFLKQTIALILIIFIYPYYIMFDKAQGNTISNGEKILEANERYIFKRFKEMKSLDGIKIYHAGYKGSLLFYKYKLSEIGQKIELVSTGNFSVNDRILISNDSLKLEVQKKYLFDRIDHYEKAELLQIISIL